MASTADITAGRWSKEALSRDILDRKSLCLQAQPHAQTLYRQLRDPIPQKHVFGLWQEQRSQRGTTNKRKCKVQTHKTVVGIKAHSAVISTTAPLDLHIHGKMLYSVHRTGEQGPQHASN